MYLHKLTDPKVLDPKCKAEHKGETWKCIFPMYRMFYVETPYTVTSSQVTLRTAPRPFSKSTSSCAAKAFA